jgi:hypothetical protein
MLACNEAALRRSITHNRFLRNPIPSSRVSQLTSTFGNHTFFLHKGRTVDHLHAATRAWEEPQLALT